MDKIKNFFDDFTFHARVMPIMVVSLPIALMAISKGVLQGDWPKNAGLILLSLVFFSMTSKIARNLGKSYEKKMYQQLGGMPSTIALRFSDDTFDEITKKRYHKKLNLFEGIALPLNVSDETTDTDQQYISASNILRNYANSNRDKEQRVYQELKEYNFWRNLYGTKSIALVAYLLIIIREIILQSPIDIETVFLHPDPECGGLIFMVLWAVAFMWLVNKKTVTQKAFDYAKSLIEVCERIPTEA